MVDNQQTQVDQVTGFLEGSFGPKQKTAFLKAFRQSGNRSRAADSVGFKFRVVQTAIKEDKAFREAFEDTLLEMRHEIEGELYKLGKLGRSKEVKQWLELNYPEEFKAPNKQAPKKSQKDSEIDALFDKLG